VVTPFTFSVAPLTVVPLPTPVAPSAFASLSVSVPACTAVSPVIWQLLLPPAVLAFFCTNFQLLPLVVSVDEVRRTRALLEQAAAELAQRGVPYRDDVPLGVMIETPAAAIAADTFAGDASFFSIGTNDLTQYTLAVDRGNANIANRFTPLHPGVLRLIDRTVRIGAEHGIDVTVCGEMASQPLMAFALIGLGVRQLSVAPRAVPLVKRLVCAISVADAERAASEALGARTALDAQRILAHHLTETAAGDPFLRDGGGGVV